MAPVLPHDILFVILDELEMIKDRVQLLQVCRYWNTALLTKVYSSINFEDAETLVPLAKALHKNPRLKPLVYKLRISDFLCDDFQRAYVYDHPLFHEFLRSFTDSNEELIKWEEKLDIEDTSAWLALVLISLPNLQLLDMRWGSYNLDSEILLWAVSKIASKSPSEDLPLQNLQTLIARAEDVPENLETREFIPFFKLPLMKRLQLDSIVDECDRKEPSFDITFDLSPCISPVREIILRYSNVKRGFQNFIAACTHLERFEYQHHNQASYEEDYRNFRCRPFHDALLSQRKSLRVLRLNDIGVTNLIYENEEDVDTFGPDIQESKAQAWFGTLVEFVALTELRMPVRNLLDSTAGKEPDLSLSEILPYGLEVLVLTKVDFVEYSMLEGQLRRLLGIRERQFSCLRKITLQTFQMEVAPGEVLCLEKRNWGVPKCAETTFAGVKSFCEEQGVEFSFSRYGDFQIVANGQVEYDTNEFGGLTTDETLY
ncbi:uncharacterized protein N7511_001287 [Penicillium nucicola]|uniref:uncharacterized protein n=1 Tax=Penicillium nucicola TaxID=1850975 RepID=UPI002545BD8E|nr:uncharacterized protein N7511_001287 [Penicillium nucicola]KAJ5776276.1 hypothetical protein N7511_001287 [Penicillium nucicola]